MEHEGRMTAWKFVERWTAVRGQASANHIDSLDIDWMPATQHRLLLR